MANESMPNQSKILSTYWNLFRTLLARIGFVLFMMAILLVYAPPVALVLVGLGLLFAHADKKRRNDVTISTLCRTCPSRHHCLLSSGGDNVKFTGIRWNCN